MEMLQKEIEDLRLVWKHGLPDMWRRGDDNLRGFVEVIRRDQEGKYIPKELRADEGLKR